MMEDKSMEETCLERCICDSESCRQNDDGTWDCSTREEDCPYHCGIG